MSALFAGGIADTASAAKRGPRGPRGFTGKTGKTGPAGPIGQTGPAGTNGVNGTGGGSTTGNFGGLATVGAPIQVTVGQFTVRELPLIAGPFCSPPTIADNSAIGALAAIGPGASFTTTIPPGSVPTAFVGPNTGNNLFAAVVTNGSSAVSGSISTTTGVAAANGCITAGFVTGS